MIAPNLRGFYSAEAAPNSLVDEWDKHMEATTGRIGRCQLAASPSHCQGFTPELLLTFLLPGRSDEFFYEVWGRMEEVPVSGPEVRSDTFLYQNHPGWGFPMNHHWSPVLIVVDHDQLSICKDTRIDTLQTTVCSVE